MEAKSDLIGVVKNPVLLRVGEPRTEFYSGVCVVNVTFPSYYVEIAEIQFKNYYTCWLSIQAKFRSGIHETRPEWKTCVERFQMMPSAHNDNGAENYYTIDSSCIKIPIINVSGLRFVLRQPSPIWKDLKIEDLCFYKHPPASRTTQTIPKWLLKESNSYDENERTLKQIPSIPQLSKHLQQMWALASDVKENQPVASVGRFDVGGCYDVTLLSYT